ncbi:MAG: toxin-antitoxin system HicB family antitoxin, partial [Caldilineae bacterium]
MGRLTVRLPDTLHRHLSSIARSEGVSLNQYIVYALTRQTALAYTVHHLSDEEIQQQRKAYE